MIYCFHEKAIRQNSNSEQDGWASTSSTSRWTETGAGLPVVFAIYSDMHVKWWSWRCRLWPDAARPPTRCKRHSYLNVLLEVRARFHCGDSLVGSSLELLTVANVCSVVTAVQGKIKHLLAGLIRQPKMPEFPLGWPVDRVANIARSFHPRSEQDKLQLHASQHDLMHAIGRGPNLNPPATLRNIRCSCRYDCQNLETKLDGPDGGAPRGLLEVAGGVVRVIAHKGLHGLVLLQAQLVVQLCSGLQQGTQHLLRLHACSLTYRTSRHSHAETRFPHAWLDLVVRVLKGASPGCGPVHAARTRAGRHQGRGPGPSGTHAGRWRPPAAQQQFLCAPS